MAQTPTGVRGGPEPTAQPAAVGEGRRDGRAPGAGASLHVFLAWGTQPAQRLHGSSVGQSGEKAGPAIPVGRRFKSLVRLALGSSPAAGGSLQACGCLGNQTLCVSNLCAVDVGRSGSSRARRGRCRPSDRCPGASAANVLTTLSGGSLGSCVDEERSQLRELM